jgi:hypothetical protein
MTTSITIDRPTTEITLQLRPTATLMPSHDLREMGLASASRRLQASVADLDVVFVARARNDLAKCPVCRMVHDFEF